MLTSATPSPVIAGILAEDCGQSSASGSDEAPVDSRVRTEAASESADKTEPEEVDVDSSGASEVQEKEDSAVVDRDIFLSGQLAAAGTSHETAIVTAHALTSDYSRIMLVTRICLLLPVLCRHNGRKPSAEA